MAMIKISGLDEMQKQLKEAENVFASLDEEIALTFNPDDPATIDAAIAKMEAVIDDKVAAHRRNPMVATVADGLKDQFRAAIMERAAQGRDG
jgi:hypothetical protein